MSGGWEVKGRINFINFSLNLLRKSRADFSANVLLIINFLSNFISESWLGNLRSDNHIRAKNCCRFHHAVHDTRWVEVNNSSSDCHLTEIGAWVLTLFSWVSIIAGEFSFYATWPFWAFQELLGENYCRVESVQFSSFIWLAMSQIGFGKNV